MLRPDTIDNLVTANPGLGKDPVAIGKAKQNTSCASGNTRTCPKNQVGQVGVLLSPAMVKPLGVDIEMLGVHACVRPS